jgi:predicted RND superfamily exporter protein
VSLLAQITQTANRFIFNNATISYQIIIATMSDETDKKEETTTPKTEEEPKKEEEVEHEESTATFEPVVSTQNFGRAMGEKIKNVCVIYGHCMLKAIN